MVTLIPQQPVNPILQKPVDTERQACLDKGGKWDADSRTCQLPEPTPPKQPKVLTPQDRKTAAASDANIIKDPQGNELTQTRLDVERDKARIAGGPGARELIASQEQQAAQAGVVEQQQEEILSESPERRELDPDRILLEKTPFIGGFFGAISDRLKERGQFKSLIGESVQPEELRTVALSEIEREEIEAGLTASEKFGALVEGIPLVGDLAANFAGGLVETPSDNAKQVKSNILKEKRRISNIETNVKLGYLPVSAATEQLTDIENNVQRLESRLRLLISNSPELKFNSDLVNTFETEILLTREKVLQGKLNVLTGASRDPTEIEILKKLEDFKSGEEEI